MMNKFDKIFSPSECISNEMMQKYISGELSADEKHLIEKHLIDCEMCSDEFEGLMLMNQSKLGSIVSDINTQIDLKSLKKTKKIRLINYKFQAIAAAILLLLFVSIFYINDFFTDKSQKLFTEYFEPYEEKANLFSDSTTKQKILVAETIKKETVIEKDVNSFSKRIDNTSIDKKTSKNNTIVTKNEVAQEVSIIVTGKSIEMIGEVEEDVITDITIANAREKTLLDNVDISFDIVADNDVSGLELEETKLADESKAILGGAVESEHINVPVTSTSNNKIVKESDEDLFVADKQDVTNEVLREESVAQTVSKQISRSSSKGKKAKNKMAKSTEYSPAPTISSISNTVEDYNNGLAQYNSKDYLSAIESFQNSINNGINKYKSSFYLGVSYLNIDNVDNAIKYLQEIENKSDKEFYQDTQWYLSLCYTKTNKISKAKKILEKLIKSDSLYKEKAKKLLEEIN